MRRLGRAGPEISALGFGTWALAGRYRFGWGAVDDDESVAAIRRAVEAGVSWVDTAPTYGDGHSEEVVGRALEPFRAGEEVLVFTKCGRPWRDGEVYFDLRPESIRAECEASLRRLQVERIDLYQFHWPDYGTGTPVEESWGTMVELVEEGKVRWLGVCNFDIPRLEACEATVKGSTAWQRTTGAGRRRRSRSRRSRGTWRSSRRSGRSRRDSVSPSRRLRWAGCWPCPA
jgi:aryl-alcohol dehydrogenase-like predicted oxidoreductase